MPDVFLAGLVVHARKCVVIGHGAEATDKALRLIEAGGDVTVFANAIEPALHALTSSGRLVWCARECGSTDLDGAFVVVQTEQNRELSARLFARAIEPGGYLLCCIDQPEFCTITNVAVVRRGHLQFAIATDGEAPALASRMREGVDASVGLDLGEFAAKIGKLRRLMPAGPARKAALETVLEGFHFTVAYRVPKDDVVAAVEAEHTLPTAIDRTLTEQKRNGAT